MSKKEQILAMFYTEHLKGTEIATILNISEAYVTKIIQTDKKYFKEKERRKSESALRHREQTKAIMRKKRKEKQELDDFVKMQHRQAVYELSDHKEISDFSFREANPSAYDYDSKRQVYVLKKGINAGFKAPKTVSNRKELGAYYYRPDKIKSFCG